MTITLDKISATSVDKLDARAQGCDRCGIDQLMRPLRDADIIVHTGFGDIFLCSTHRIAAGDGMDQWDSTDLTDL